MSARARSRAAARARRLDLSEGEDEEFRARAPALFLLCARNHAPSRRARALAESRRHVAAALGADALAAHQITLQLYFFLSPACEVLSQSAQTFLPRYVSGA